MTAEEAIKYLDNVVIDEKFGIESMVKASAIVNTCKEALEKQIPKKPLNVTDSIEDLRFDWTCPSCKRQFVGASHGVNHCVDCGQKIDWEGVE